ncbi:MAG: hypothetical protein GTN53_23010, partial [Candidatus Aminicenantes bacterium]|nr:hypothetical protein [Candidatus Aminicenantes bacterium]NIQ69374.1 hypothetical protein [Candidatus Aminicenantes bacterium]NIT25375.1 hypothetical protein [Candidatus Aminicenantes bacterium]
MAKKRKAGGGRKPVGGAGVPTAIFTIRVPLEIRDRLRKVPADKIRASLVNVLVKYETSK